MPAVISEAGFPYCERDDVEAFRIVFGIETFLRRMLRWESYGQYGRTWDHAIPKAIFSEIENRQNQERDLVVVDHYENSPFSFLLSTELERTITEGPLWSKTFCKFFPPLAVVAADFQVLYGIRNKVGHFRPITEDDLANLGHIRRNLRKAASHYEDVSQRIAYIGGYLEELELACDSAEQEKIERILGKADAKPLWSYFLNDLQQLSADGISIGIGTLAHHVFFQIRVAGTLPGKALLKLFDRWCNQITFVSIGQLGDFIRVFIPLIEAKSGAAQEVAASICGAVKGNIGSASVEPRSEVLQPFGVGRREAILSEGKATFVSFVF